MKALEKSIRLFFWFALALSIGFPFGIVAIVFGAINSWISLLIFGILLTVAGFYAMPILWVNYGERRGYRALLLMIENDGILTIRDLAAHTGKTEKVMRDKILFLINKHYLTGYLFADDRLEKIDKTPEVRLPERCPNCGAEMVVDGERYKCEYCGGVF